MLHSFLIKKIFFLIIIFPFVFSLELRSNAVNNLSGYVRDASNGETVIGATVFIKGTKKGAYTNKKGFYSISDIPPGKQVIIVKSIGFEILEQELEIPTTESIRKDFELNSGSVQMDEIYVESDREVEKRQISISKVNIPVETIKNIRIGGESDVFRSLQLLPGVLTSSQVSSGLFIRGGSPDQNLVLLDGSTIYNPSHLFGFFSAFNSEAIKDVDLIKGGYPAEFGSRLSSVINITQKDGNKKEFEGLVNLGLISSKFSLEGPTGIKGGSFFIGGRRTYFDIIKPLFENLSEDPIPDFYFYDINAKITQDIGQNDKVYLSGFLSQDNFDFFNQGFDVGLYYGNRVGALGWTHIFNGNFFTTVNLTGSLYTNGFGQDIQGFNVDIENNIRDYSVKGGFDWFINDALTLKGGFEIQDYKFSYLQNFSGTDTTITENTTDNGGIFKLEVFDQTYAGYSQFNAQVNDKFSLQTGLRVNWWNFSEDLTFDPRAAVRYQFMENFSVKASWGIYHQYLRLASNENFAVFDTWLPTDTTVNPSRAVHYILAFQTRPRKDLEFNFDLYYKDLSNISELNNTSIEGSTVADVFFNGNGEAYGLELFLQKKMGKFTGWIGYALGWVNVRFDSVNSGREYNPRYDRRHDFKIVAQYELSDRWSVGGTFTLQSGQPFTGATSRFQILMPGRTNGEGTVVPSDRFGLRLPPTHQLNLNASYSYSLFGLDSKVILDIFNVYNRQDILFRFYNTSGSQTRVEDVRLLPIIPTVSFEIKF